MDNFENHDFDTKKYADHMQGEFAASPRPDQERVDGEYRFTRPEAERSAYSDAGFVPAQDASNMPRSYPYGAPAEPKQKKQREKNSAAVCRPLR